MAPNFPPIFLLKALFERDLKGLRAREQEMNVVFDVNEAKLFLGKIQKRARARYELRQLGLYTEDVTSEERPKETKLSSPPRKRRKVEVTTIDGRDVIALDSDTESDASIETPDFSTTNNNPAGPGSSNTAVAPTIYAQSKKDTVKVLKVEWYDDSVAAGKLLPFDKYLVYEGVVIPRPERTVLPAIAAKNTKNDILARARADTPPPPRYNKKCGHSYHSSQTPPPLLHRTTSEYEGTDIPTLPSFMHFKYSCQRPTPVRHLNDEFIAQLRIIQKQRAIKYGSDEKGDMRARSYNRSIASIAAYPYKLTSAAEIRNLPNCGQKVANAWQEWNETGIVNEVDEIQRDDRMQALFEFVEIHDVAGETAKKFYDQNGWHSIDDIIEHGWNQLTRGQKVGLKYLDDFQKRIPRDEVEAIAKVVLDHANKIREGFQMVICGGYRRGKSDSGDVDVILSHPDEDATDRFLKTLLDNLENDEYLTHRLEVSQRNSDRGQSPLHWKGGMPRFGRGFDSLDHAFVVWQDPEWPSKKEDIAKDPDFPNPNLHRRVDIIVSPWKTAGCAVIGWSGGTMFERDLRGYVKETFDYKFDSTGVRARSDGSWIDLEEGDGDLLVKEKRVFDGLGLEWREPTERCTD